MLRPQPLRADLGPRLGPSVDLCVIITCDPRQETASRDKRWWEHSLITTSPGATEYYSNVSWTVQKSISEVVGVEAPSHNGINMDNIGRKVKSARVEMLLRDLAHRIIFRDLVVRLVVCHGRCGVSGPRNSDGTMGCSQTSKRARESTGEPWESIKVQHQCVAQSTQHMNSYLPVMLRSVTYHLGSKTESFEWLDISAPDLAAGNLKIDNAKVDLRDFPDSRAGEERMF